MGAWSPGHAAGELAAQLGIALPEPAHVDAAEISRNVDREARGDGTLLTAYHQALSIADALPDDPRIVVVRPLHALPIRSDNRALLRYLLRLGIAVRFAGGRSPSPPAALPPLLQLYPGLVPAPVVAALGIAPDHPALQSAGPAHYTIAPGARTIDPRCVPALIDQLAAYEHGDPRLFAYCQCLGTALFVDAPALAGYAQAAVQASADLALALAKRARACARTPIDAAATELQLQGIRIFLHQFAEAAAAPEPSPRLPAALRGELSVMRGWGKVMIGDVDAAERCFAETGPARDAATALYHRNIFAFARFRHGDLDGARAIEREIEGALASDSDPDPQLHFVNAINLARLSRAAGDDQGYCDYLRRAFATTDNVRSASEIVQLNLLRAQTLDRGDPDQARRCRLRAALAWLASEPAEAISVRAIRVAIDPGAAHPRTLDRQIAEMLLTALAAAWPAVTPLVLDTAPHVALSDAADGLVVEQIGAAEGVCLLWSPMRQRRLPRAPATDGLAALAFAIIAAEVDLPASPSAGTWIIDTVTGADVRASRVDSAAAAWRYGLEQGTAAPIVVRAGPAVRRIETRGGGDVVHFKRHLPPRRLSEAERGVVSAVARCGTIAVDRIERPDIVRALVAARVLGLGSDVA
ncbi:hypothetical protein [Sphingomonas sp. 28-63-12]|uniref:hypothetical protein n=1 Tax=Sphingomonas sp. 28-63-12 TaxID=1970434 RepID=UPI0035A820DA